MLTIPARSANGLIPLAFLKYKQFLNWKIIRGEKLPCDGLGNVVNAHDPAVWMSADQALASPLGLGVAFVFTDADPFFFIDLDKAYDGAHWSQIALDVCGLFPGAAVEVSQSGTGLHIFGSATIGKHRTRSRTGHQLEAYSSGRFCAITGLSSAGDAGIDFTAQFATLISRYGLEPDPDAPAGTVAAEGKPWPNYAGPADDAELVALMCASRGSAATMMQGKPHIRELWTGDAVALARHYPQEGRADGAPFDRSRADAALMGQLAFWTGCDAARMERLFLSSGLARPGHYSGSGAYRMLKIVDSAVTKCKRVYDYQKAAPASAAGVPVAAERASGVDYLRTDQQQEFFAGCVYIADRHAILTPNYGLLGPDPFRVIYGGYEFQMQADGAGRKCYDAWEAFTRSRVYQFPKVQSAVFRPFEEPGAIIDGSMVNIWRPVLIKMREGDVRPFLDHLAKLLPDHRDRKILLTYMQSLVQNPGVKFQWAPVLQGVPGNGKTFLATVMCGAVGERYAYMPKASRLSEKFNEYLEAKLFIGVEEIRISEERREMVEILKDMITNRRIEVRYVGGRTSMVENYSNWMFMTNYQDAIPVDKNDRRFAMLFSAQQQVEDLDRDGMSGRYFTDLYDWYNHEGGAEAVNYFLHHSEIDPEFDPALSCQRAPSTSSTEQAIAQSRGRIEQEIMEAVHDGLIGFRGGWLSTWRIQQLLKEKGLRTLSPGKMRDALKSIGYSFVGKSSKLIMSEEGTRPGLWALGRLTGKVEDYLIAQGLDPSG